MSSGVTLVCRPLPLAEAEPPREVEAGLRLSDYVDMAGVPPALRKDVRVVVYRNGRGGAVPDIHWKFVRPREGSHVSVIAHVAGGGIKDILKTVALVAVAFAAPAVGAYIAGSAVLGLTGAAFVIGSTAIAAGFAVGASLLINSVIAPPQPSLSSFSTNTSSAIAAPDPSERVTGIRNNVSRYTPVPLVIGRHKIIPEKSGIDFTSVSGQDNVYLTSRFCLGYGGEYPPVLHNIRIGETAIAAFAEGIPSGFGNILPSGSQIAFRNVRQAETDASNGLWNFYRNYTYGSTPMTPYSQRVIQDNFNLLLEHAVGNDTTLQAGATSYRVFFEFPQGVGNVASNADGTYIEYREIFFAIEHYPVDGLGGGTSRRDVMVSGSTNSPLLRSYVNALPAGAEAGRQYGVRITRLTPNAATVNELLLSRWLGVTSNMPGTLIHDENLVEVVLKVRANEAASGVLDPFNCEVEQYAPQWTGVTWTEPRPVNHAAWGALQVLRGSHLKTPYTDDEILLNEFKDWADRYPDHRCDYVARGDERLQDTLDVVTAAGRAKWRSSNGKVGIIMDAADDLPSQVFSPNNAWDFNGETIPPKDVHALMVSVVSAHEGWKTVEFPVYAPGRNAGNSSVFEPFEIPGVIIQKGDTTQGRPWREAKFHIAQYFLRPEKFSFKTKFEGLTCKRGDKILLTHHVPQVGSTWGIVDEVGYRGSSILWITLRDGGPPPQTSNLVARIRRGNGTLVYVPVNYDDGKVYFKENVSEGAVQSGDMVLIDEGVPFEAIITAVEYDNLEVALIRAIPAAPGIENAALGEIPSYDPQTFDGAAGGTPTTPEILDYFSGDAAATTLAGGSVVPRVGLILDPRQNDTVPVETYRVTYAPTANPESQTTFTTPVGDGVVYTDALVNGAEYTITLRGVSFSGIVGPPSAEIVVTALLPAVNLQAPVAMRVSVVGNIMQASWQTSGPAPSGYVVRYSTAEPTNWSDGTTLGTVAGTSYSGVPVDGWIMIAGQDSVGRIGPFSFVQTDSLSFVAHDEIREVQEDPDWAGTLGDSMSISFEELVCDPAGLTPVPGSADAWTDYYEFENELIVGNGAEYECGIFFEQTSSATHSTDPAFSDWSVSLEVSLYVSGAWEPWIPAPASATFERVKFRLAVTSGSGDAVVTVEAAKVTVDLPDRVERAFAVTVPVSGLPVFFDVPFAQIPSVFFTPVVAESGARPVIGSITPTGFDVTYQDAAGDLVEVVVDWKAIGHGTL